MMNLSFNSPSNTANNNVRFGYRSDLKRIVNAGAADCAYCERPFTESNRATLEHIRPHSKGGVSNVSNYLPVHARCNQIRGNEDFAPYIRTHQNKIGYIQNTLNELRGQIIDGRDYVPAVARTLNRESQGYTSFHGAIHKGINA